jgi:hypothetical protein
MYDAVRSGGDGNAAALQHAGGGPVAATPASITALSKEVFIDAAWEVVGRKVSKVRLLGDIYDAAASSIGLPVAADSPVPNSGRRSSGGGNRRGLNMVSTRGFRCQAKSSC